MIMQNKQTDKNLIASQITKNYRYMETIIFLIYLLLYLYFIQVEVVSSENLNLTLLSKDPSDCTEVNTFKLIQFL